MLSKPRLKGSWQKVRHADGSVMLLHELSNRRLRIPDEDGVASGLLRALDGARDAGEVARVVHEETGADPEVVSDAIASLAAVGVLEDAALPPPDDLPPEYLAAFRRNAYYFAEFETPARSRYDMLRALHDARVAVLGLGGTGSWILAALVAAGVGRLRGADGDVVGPENLGRQILYRQDDVGKPKARAMGDELARFNPAIAFEGVEGVVRSRADVARLVDGADFLVVGCVGPRFTLYRWVDDACRASGTPYLIVETRQVGPLVVPGESACYACYEAHLRSFHPYYDRLVAALDRDAAATERMPQFGPLVAYSATRAALEVVRHVSRHAPPETVGAVLQLDGADLAWKRFAFERRPDCPSCNGGVPHA